MSLDRIQLSQQARDHLVSLKRYTGIKQWNILCRWALCLSLSEPTAPPNSPPPADSNVEMTWRVLAGSEADIYLAALKHRCRTDGLDTDPETLEKQLRLHLHRGIARLAGNTDVRSIESLVQLSI